MGSRYFFTSITYLEKGKLRFDSITTRTDEIFVNRESVLGSHLEYTQKTQKNSKCENLEVLNVFEFPNKAAYDFFNKKEFEVFSFGDENCDTNTEQNELDRMKYFFNESELSIEVSQEDQSFDDGFGLNVVNYNYEVNYEGVKFKLSFAEKTNKEHFVEDFIDGYESVSPERLMSLNPIGSKTVSAKTIPVVTNEGDFFLLKWEIE